MRACVAITLVAALCLAVVPGLASADKLIMKNGDVISGEVTSIDGDEVKIDPTYTDEFAVDLAEVASIETDQTFDVELDDGRAAPARFAGGEDGMQTMIVEDKTYEVALADLHVAEPPEPWYERASHVDLNVVWNDGNTDSRSNLLFADTRIRLGEHRHLGALTIARDETDGVDTKKQDLFRYEYNWLFNDPWYLGATASYERDPIKELDHRYTLGALIGRDLINNDTTVMTFSTGVGYSEQELAGVTDSGAVGLWNFNYTQDLRGGDLAFFHNHNLNYQFYGDNNLILKTNTGFRFDIVEGVYFTTSLRYDYESEPAEGTKDYDATLAIGLGAEF